MSRAPKGGEVSELNRNRLNGSAPHPVPGVAGPGGLGRCGEGLEDADPGQRLSAVEPAARIRVDHRGEGLWGSLSAHLGPAKDRARTAGTLEYDDAVGSDRQPAFGVGCWLKVTVVVHDVCGRAADRVHSEQQRPAEATDLRAGPGPSPA